jgi:hypothetical protein
VDIIPAGASNTEGISRKYFNNLGREIVIEIGLGIL